MKTYKLFLCGFTWFTRTIQNNPKKTHRKHSDWFPRRSGSGRSDHFRGPECLYEVISIRMAATEQLLDRIASGTRWLPAARTSSQPATNCSEERNEATATATTKKESAHWSVVSRADRI